MEGEIFSNPCLMLFLNKLRKRLPFFIEIKHRDKRSEKSDCCMCIMGAIFSQAPLFPSPAAKQIFKPHINCSASACVETSLEETKPIKQAPG